MKRNFLILMLLSLLPLAGWAQTAVDISAFDFTVDTQNFEFNTEDQSDDITVTVVTTNPNTGVALVATDYDLVITNAAGTAATFQNAGTYYLQLKGKGDYTGTTTKKIELSMAKADLNVAIGNATGTFTKAYKSYDPTIPATNTWTFTWGTNATNMENATGVALLTLTTPGYNYTGENADANGYNITFTGIALTAEAEKNYTLKIAARKMVITPVAITANATELTFSPNAATTVKYTGNNQKPAYAITYTYRTSATDATQTATYNLTASDFSVKNYVGTTETEVVNVDNYTAKVFAGTSGNFTVTEGGVAITAFSINIEKPTKKLSITPIKQEKATYDGESLDLTTAEYFITGWAAGDDADVQESRANIFARLMEENNVVTDNENNPVTVVGPDAGAYTVKADATTATYKNGILLSKNYELNEKTSTWKINQRPLHITVSGGEISYGETVPALTSISVTAENGEIVGQEAVITEFTKAYGTYGTDNTQITAQTNDIPVGTYAGVFKVTYNANSNVLKNYDLGVDGANVTFGQLKVTGAPFYVYAAVPSTIQYGRTYTPVAMAENAEGDNIDDYELATGYTEIAYIYKNATTGATLDSKPTALGSYTVEVNPACIVGTGNFDDSTPTCPTYSFSIVPKKLTINVPAVELWNGATSTILNQKYAADNYSEQMVNSETISIELDFANAITGANVATDATTGVKTITFENNYTAQNNAIVAKIKETGDYYANYTIETVTGGTLTQTATAGITIDLDAATASTKIADCAAICAANQDVTYTVTITGKTLTADKWNTMVLPFEVTTFDFCKAINGYAVFNRLKSGNPTANTVKFGLEIDYIPANEPFLVKPLNAVDFATESGDPAQRDYKFTEVTFASGSPVKTVSGAQFIGTYTNTEKIQGGTGIKGFANGELVNVSSGTADFNYLTAYLKLSSDFVDPDNARIYVEEADGSVTAIAGIAADGTAIEADGWYNLNGVKMQGVPAQKGIYIRNGKKIVVK